MEEKRLGKIKNIAVGIKGYQDAMLGLHVELAGDSWGVGDSRSFWDYNLIQCTEHCSWTEETRDAQAAEVMRCISDYLAQAKVNDVASLKGVPIEATFDGMKLQSWRILNEVL